MTNWVGGMAGDACYDVHQTLVLSACCGCSVASLMHRVLNMRPEESHVLMCVPSYIASTSNCNLKNL